MNKDTQLELRGSTLPRPSRRTICCIAVLTTAHVFLLAYSATRHSPTDLEGPLLAAGVSHWKRGRYELYRVNPPLVRIVAAIPVVLVGCKTNWSRFVDGPGSRPEYSMGSQFVQLNGERSFWLMTLARWACIPFSLVGGIFCFLWARELYANNGAGLMALTLWCFDPMILGHGELITNDVAAASLGLGACYFYWKWLQSPTWMRSIPAGCFLALAILAKTTWLVLFAIWPVMGFVWLWKTARQESVSVKSFASRGIQIAFMFVLAIWAINTFYGFDGSFERYGDYSFVSQTTKRLGNDRAWLRELPVPFPRQFVLGLDTQISDFEGTYQPSSYLAGRWQGHGWWYYYLYGLLVKLPHGTQALLLLVLTVRLRQPFTGNVWNELVLLAPALVVFVLVSAKTVFTHHFRYVLPCFGFGFVFLAQSINLGGCCGGVCRVVTCALVTCTVLSSLTRYPHLLAYFNEAVGGPRNGYKHMLHSSLDWGQDLLHLKWWLEEHPEAQPLKLAYGGGFEASAVGMDYERPPLGPNSRVNGTNDQERVGPLPGWYALSVNHIWAWSPEYHYFQRFQPVATAGYSIYIYHITLDEANRVRKELGPPELKTEVGTGRAEAGGQHVDVAEKRVGEPKQRKAISPIKRARLVP